MKYNYTTGNLLNLFDKGEVDIIAHGANCYNQMGAGIALQIKQKYPDAFYADKYFPLSNGIERLGNLSCNDKMDIFNLYTQNRPGPNADLLAIRLSLRKLNDLFDPANIGMDFITLGLPLIGCGIGGLAWDDVDSIVREEITNLNVLIVHYDEN